MGIWTAGSTGAAWLLSMLASQPVDLRIEGPARVGKYEKVEFVIEVGRTFPNPFDPAEVEVDLEIKTPSGKTVVLPAFWYQPYEREAGGRGRKEDWLYPSGAAHFRARYAPSETGAHSCRARRKDKTGTARSKSVSFEAVASTHKGYVRVSKKDPRFFELDDSTPFFPIGQNTAFLGGSQYLSLARVEEVYRKMSENGANYARIWTCCEDWALALEARKSAWGRSWSWKPPFETAEGRTAIRVSGSPLAVAPTHPVALRPGTKYELSGSAKTDGDAALVLELGGPLGEPVRGRGWTEFKRPFTSKPDQKWLGNLSLRAAGSGEVRVRGLSLREAAGGPELLWEADPDRPRRGTFNLPDAFMLDVVVQAAEKHGIRLQFCFITRDLYMKDLEKKEDDPAYRQAVEDARRLLRYVVARWGYSTSVASWEYFNEMNPGAPTNAAYREWAKYFDEIDPCLHLRSTSAWGPAPRDYAHPDLSFADLHWYLRPAWGELSKDAAAAALERAKFLREKAPGKPALLGEFGLADDKWGLSPHMKEDKELVHFHNALWASALSGLSGTALFWWWDQLDRMNAYPHYRPLANFLAGIPFTTAGLQAFTAEGAARKSRVAGLKGNTSAFLWIQNPRATWHRMVVEKAAPAETSGESVVLEGLEPGTYKIEWWHTYEGKVLKKETVAVAGGRLMLSVPSFSRDIACKVTR